MEFGPDEVGFVFSVKKHESASSPAFPWGDRSDRGIPRLGLAADNLLRQRGKAV